jgi:hypothetical protein
MVYAMRSFEKINEDDIEEWPQSDACEVHFQLDRQTDIVNAVVKQKGKEECKDSESEIYATM